MSMRDQEYHRFHISKRAAVKALVDINKALSDLGHCYFWGTFQEKDGYDISVYSMADDIRRLKEEVAEYRKLKAALKPLLKR